MPNANMSKVMNQKNTILLEGIVDNEPIHIHGGLFFYVISERTSLDINGQETKFRVRIRVQCWGKLSDVLDGKIKKDTNLIVSGWLRQHEDQYAIVAEYIKGEFGTYTG